MTFATIDQLYYYLDNKGWANYFEKLIEQGARQEEIADALGRDAFEVRTEVFVSDEDKKDLMAFIDFISLVTIEDDDEPLFSNLRLNLTESTL